MAVFEVDPSVVYSIIAVLPPAGVFFAAYGRYDGGFRDNIVFLYFMGGLLMGFLLGFLTVLALGTALGIVGTILLALIFPIALTMGINRRKWQGDRHAVFNGGAFGIGVALMLGFTFLYVLYRNQPLTVVNLAQALLFTAGITGIFFGLGLLSGNAVRLRKPFRAAIMGTAIMLAPTIFLFEFAASGAWLWVALLLAYGAIFGVAAERRLLVEGLSEEARKNRRRRRRAARPE